MPKSNTDVKTIPLRFGDLQILSATDIEGYCDFASRINPKRPFLFVSKVLGRHIPIRPTTLRSLANSMCQKLLSYLGTGCSGPILLIGLAETAVSLGQAIHEEITKATGRNDILYIHSTRHSLPASTLIHFKEEHSHAVGHRIYTPIDPHRADMLMSAKTLIMIDDEVTTGRTFVNLREALWKRGLHFDQSLALVIMDWRGDNPAYNAPLDDQSLPILSEAQATFNFLPYANQNDADPLTHSQALPSLTKPPNVKSDSTTLLAPWGRLGITHPITLPQAIIAQVGALNANDRILVLGTGEFCHPSFLIAEYLEAKGHHVYCQAITRSPIYKGGAIKHVLQIWDNYGENTINWLYNADFANYDRVLVCTETPSAFLDPQLRDHPLSTIINFNEAPHRESM